MNDQRFEDRSKSIDERVESLVSGMTLNEKIDQTLHAAPAVPRLGIPAYNWWNECLHGVARAGRATVFPQAIGLAATFHDELVHRIAVAISDEARAKHHQALKLGNHGQYFGLTYWTPNINIFRDPRWGRGQETYGECPFLTSRMGVAFCKGLQGDDPDYLKLVATPKHYAVHSGPESERHVFNAEVSPRDLRETYLAAFKACVQEAGAYSVMGAYNRVDGEPCCGSKTLLQDILRDEWGFDGFVVSDCWAIRDFHQTHGVSGSHAESDALAIRNGCDLNVGEERSNLMQALDEGLITEEEIDAAVKRLFKARFKLGMFDPEQAVPYAAIPPEVVHSREHVELSLQAARESMVLLKNNGILPLRKDLPKMALVGPNAMSIDALLGNYTGYAPNMVTVVEGMMDAVSAGTQVFVANGCDLCSDAPVAAAELEWGYLEPNDVVVAVLGNTSETEGEEPDVAASDGGGDRTTIDLPGRQLDLLKHLKSVAPETPLILVVLSGSAVDLTWAQEHCDAVLYGWYPGEQGGRAAADVLFGDYNPAGRLPVTVVKSLEQLPDFRDYAMKGRTYRFMEQEPLYRFGYGLSYTRFTYENLRAGGFDPVSVSVDVTNIGERDGDEVIQLYVKDVEASVPVALRQLKAFRRIHLEAGETQTVSFELTSSAFEVYDDEGKPFVEAGAFEISVGGGLPEDETSGAISVLIKV
ncbi:Xylan 1,4-beta-xylosidase [Pontiella desulfatans]|uniref:Xylan 1,4-beta-xylosidase n=1 Tax=Pontiella desulfatans TaxID=2750659 RepID=A0A6C2U9L4_PONDE|nr:glycoside hydrolase family 3 N-terminal domain-containing protein [Pontiella desulfatans]VGO16211.1 Xylan 1,4-beta-xylosidase [Pontiella desulfatans]